MTATEPAWPVPGWRRIPDWPHYVIHRDTCEVWSVGRQVPCKGGKTRWAPAKPIRPDTGGRVPLSRPGQVRLAHVARFLHPLTFPEKIRPQVMCRGGHPLTTPIRPRIFGSRFAEPNVVEWGTGNRVCLYCHRHPQQHAVYSPSWGTAQPLSDHRYSDLPATPHPRRPDDDVDEDGEPLIHRIGLFADNFLAYELTRAILDRRGVISERLLIRNRSI